MRAVYTLLMMLSGVMLSFQIVISATCFFRFVRYVSG